MKCSHWNLPYVTIFAHFIQCSDMKFRRVKSVNLNPFSEEQNQLDMNSVHLQQWEMNLQITLA
jgi:hypothetical protein